MRRRFRLPFRRLRELRRDIDAELAHHLAAATDDLIRAGVDPSTAQRQAQDRLRNLRALKQGIVRHDWLSERRRSTAVWLDGLHTDLGFAIRLARRRRATSLLMVVTLALGIGIATAFAAAVDAVLIRSLPLRQPEAVMRLWRVHAADGRRGNVAPGTVADWRERARSFSHVAAAEPFGLDYDDGTGARSIGTWRVTDGFFEIMHMAPTQGRSLEAHDYEDGAEAVVVISHDFWRSRLHSDPAAVGRVLRLDGAPVRVVGILAPQFPYAEQRQLYVAGRLTSSVRENRRSDYYLTYGRLAPGATPQSGETELQTIAQHTALEFPESDAGLSAAVTPLAEALTADVRPGLLLLMLAAWLILGVACVNAAGLLLTEALRRGRELAIRAVVGAGRQRIVMQQVTEAMLLTTVAGVLGFGIAAFVVTQLRVWAPVDMPRIAELTLDLRLLGIGAAIILMVSVAVAVPSAARALTGDLHAAIKRAGSGGSSGPAVSRLRRLLVVVEVSLAVDLLAGGALLFRSWVVLTRTDQGYSPAGVAAAEAHFWDLKPTPEGRFEFTRQVVDEIRSRPGLRATVASTLPLTRAIGNEDAEAQLPGTATTIAALGMAVGAQYFDVLGIGLRDGHAFDAILSPDGEPVVVVNETLARRLWPGGQAVGQILLVSYNGPSRPHRVLGVARDVRYHSLERAEGPTVYLPYTQTLGGSLFFVATDMRDARVAENALVHVLRALAPTLGIDQVVQMEAQVRGAAHARRFSLFLLGAFALASVVLTGIGLFGLMAHTIRSRTQELGLRMALGAGPRLLRLLVLGEAARLVSIGVAVGLAAFAAISGVLRNQLYGVAPHDPIALGAAGVVVAGVALLATWAPARMATQIDPASALRVD